MHLHARAVYLLVIACSMTTKHHSEWCVAGTYRETLSLMWLHGRFRCELVVLIIYCARTSIARDKWIILHSAMFMVLAVDRNRRKVSMGRLRTRWQIFGRCSQFIWPHTQQPDNGRWHNTAVSHSTFVRSHAFHHSGLGSTIYYGTYWPQDIDAISSTFPPEQLKCHQSCSRLCSASTITAEAKYSSRKKHSMSASLCSCIVEITLQILFLRFLIHNSKKINSSDSLNHLNVLTIKIRIMFRVL